MRAQHGVGVLAAHPLRRVLGWHHHEGLRLVVQRGRELCARPVVQQDSSDKQCQRVTNTVLLHPSGEVAELSSLLAKEQASGAAQSSALTQAVALYSWFLPALGLASGRHMLTPRQSHHRERLRRDRVQPLSAKTLVYDGVFEGEVCFLPVATSNLGTPWYLSEAASAGG